MATAAASPDRQRADTSRRPPERADTAAWLAVAAGTLGALMATLDISIVNSSLPTIQGEIGASGTEGTWIATAYLVAEIVIIPMAAWLERLLGLRTFLLIAAALFTAFSVLCGVSTTLTMMIVGRVGQGFTGGAMIPTAQTIIAQRLPRRQQPVGIAMFGVTAIMGPVIGPLIGGWLTENVSWHYAFFLNVPICAILVTLLLLGLKHERVRLDLLGEADWVGIAGLALGLGGLTVFLEEGQREQWFSSELIRYMFAVMVVGFGLLFWGQATARRPIIKLKLLLDRQFGSVALMGVVLGIVLYGTSYVIPQFLSLIAGYNALQSGKVVLLSGIPSLILMAMVPILLRRVDIRIAVGGGLCIMGASALMDANLTLASDGADFTVSQLLRGVGQILGMLFLSQAVVRSVPPEDAGDASGLFNAVRNLGGSLALAGISIIQDQRSWFHSRRIEETLNANSQRVQDYVAGLGAGTGGDAAALRLIGRQVQGQALVMTFNDIFWIMGMGTMLVLPLVLFLRPLPKDAAPAAMH
ncbi:MFS transporter, DHA2 family, multidrug resistance protein [Sphingomonas gellani]|uniref:MFS transporter, DHA2 family, multidrug resistance protein n=1 Tax=Sphingomonas gellani TaxID=1166340 RepID=A0A1H8AKU3_9SPHN|nr:MDR family MFS transporter [Sphingomonas gellani]SEM71251.1 MFS transporter, DHA2 family, multidrug resistance protein [Sphingomonas gellani]